MDNNPISSNYKQIQEYYDLRKSAYINPASIMKSTNKKGEDDDPYIIVPNEIEQKVLLTILDQFFKTRLTQNKSYEKFEQKYYGWKDKSINPSSKTIYNVMKRYTPVIKRDNQVLFTLTQTHGVYYRVRHSLLKEISTVLKETKLSKLVEEYESSIITSTSSETNNDITMNDTSPSTDVTPITDGREENQEVVANQRTKYEEANLEEKTLIEVAEELEKRMEKETAKIQAELKDTEGKANLDYTGLINEIINKETPIIQKKIMDNIERNSKTVFDNLQTQMDKLTQKVLEATKMVDENIGMVRRTCASFQTKVQHCREKLSQVEATIDDRTKNLDDIIKNRVEILADNIVEDLNEQMELAENEIQISALAFTNQVKSLEQSTQKTARDMGRYRTHNLTLQEIEKLRLEVRNEIKTIKDVNLQEEVKVAQENIDVHLIATIGEIEKQTESAVERITNAAKEVHNPKKQPPKLFPSNPYTRDRNSQQDSQTTMSRNHPPQVSQSQHQEDRSPKRIHNPYRTHYDVNTEYLRKNIKMSCPDDAHLLDFYIKLRLVVVKGGISLIPIENITLDQDLAEDWLDSPTRQMQSNALHTILMNEDVIPSDYIRAQNCIQAKSDTMDGFGALKSMLLTVHPNLTKRAPSDVAPVFTSYNDLSLYEQSLRNHYLQHYLYDGHRRTDLQKSQQFLKGLDGEQYQEAKLRVINQLDNVRNFGGDVPPQYCLDNLGGTITNMSEYSLNLRPQVNVMQQMHRRKNPNEKSTGQQRNGPKKSWSRRPMVNVQCGACKQFGHKTIDCNHVGKVLAIMDLQSNHPRLCKKILETHIQKNDPEKRLAIIRSLQDLDAIPNDKLPEECLLDEAYNNAIDHTVNVADSMLNGDTELQME